MTGHLFTMLIVLSLWCSCSHSIGGAGGETTNGVITGRLVENNELYCASVQVSLFPAEFDPVKENAAFPDVFTDTAGQYVFSQVPQGDYSIVAADTATGSKTLITGIHIDNDTFVAPIESLQTPGTIKTFLLPGSKRSNGYVYIPGTRCHAFINTPDDFVLLDSVPAGIIPQMSYSCRDSSSSEVIRFGIRVVSSDTAVIRNPSWRYTRGLRLNTSESGAGIPVDLIHFPILVRLTAENFDFSLAQEDGADLRFAKTDGAMLPLEIERWDAQRKHAEVWVKIDTVHGNDSEQSITMYWGNPEAGVTSNGSEVFDTADGFAGVWHLGDEIEDSFRDATANQFHGVSPDTAQPLRVDGVTGYCRRFNGIDDYIVMPNTASGALDFPEASEYTIYAWVSPDSIDNASHLIVAKGHSQYFLWLTYSSANTSVWEFVEFGQSINWQVSSPVQTISEWALLVGVRKGDQQLLFCNGTLIDSSVNKWPQAFPRDASANMTIGRFLNGVPFMTNDGASFFKGSIDEVRIARVAHSPEWIRLCYMNQQSDDRLIEFE
jgi:hypothetical protein